MADAATPALLAERLSVAYPAAAGEAVVVRDLSLTVAPGECLGIVGESGAGKSQAFLAMMGILPASARVSGRVRLGQTELLGLPRAELNRVRGGRMSMIFQDHSTSLTPHLTIGEQIIEVIVRHRGGPKRAARAAALELLERVQMSDPARRIDQYPHELSGGMRQRAMIAMAISCGPSLLIADEPTTALDVTVQAQILGLLARLKREQRMSIVLITHDLGVVAGLADRVAVMQGGCKVEENDVRALFAAPAHPHTQALLEAARGGAGTASERGPRRADPGASLGIARLSVEYRLRGARRGEPRVLRAVDDVSFEVRAGEAVGLVGESGCGKSTLVRAVLRLVPPSAGTVIWAGRALERLAPREMRALRGELQIIFQDALGSLDPRMTAGEIVAEPLAIHRPQLSPAQRANAALRMLARVGLPPDAARRLPHELSGGQCQRVGIARAMILEPRLLVCDEPVSALDATLSEEVVRLIDGLRREQGAAVLFVSHDLTVVRRLCERVLVLYLGRTLELGPTELLGGQPLHPYTRALLAAVPVPDPSVQPGRLRSAPAGEPPSPTEPPSGCVFRTRCPHAAPVCAAEPPRWEPAGDERWVACHRWRELEPG